MKITSITQSAEYEILSGSLEAYQLNIPTLNIGYLLQQIKPKGNIVYEYNPLHNFRYSSIKDKNNKEVFRTDFRGDEIIPDAISDLDTEKFKFNLKYPVDITCLPSYDGSVNLILNDNINNPRLINTRFSVRGLNTYEVVDRIGSNDTNLYDENQFELDTSLFKRIIKIPKIEFLGLSLGGKMPVGNYNFYFKYSDADGNETDFIGESGSVVCHIGNLNDPSSIRGGLLDEDSLKSILFVIDNVDSAYDFVNVYYTRQSSGMNQERPAQAFKIDRKYKIKSSSCLIIIDGYENIVPVTLEEINIKYFITDRAKTQVSCLNRLFLGNLSKPTIDHQLFLDLSLRMFPYYKKYSEKDCIGSLDINYTDNNKKYAYYNVNNIYNKVGYWDEEIYRVGVVYIMNDDSLSPVFNIRGRNEIPYCNATPTESFIAEKYTVDYDEDIGEIKVDLKTPISYDVTTYKIGNGSYLENSKGVIRFNDVDNNDNNTFGIYSLGIYIPKQVLNILKTKVKGLFFVRQKRIPTILAQAFTIGHDNYSGLPLISYAEQESDETQYIIEGFTNEYINLEAPYEQRLIKVDKEFVSNESAICPEYELRLPFFNNLFTNTQFTIKSPNYRLKNELKKDSLNVRHYYSLDHEISDDSQFKRVDILGIGDSIHTKQTKTTLYSSVAGNAEMPEQFKYVGKKFKIDYINSTAELEEDAKKHQHLTSAFSYNIVRGAYGPYLGFTGYLGQANMLYNIYIPGYTPNKMDLYFRIRYEDSAPYQAISDRISIFEIYNENNLFRGDCYICNYTHRINRNFLDLQAPNADIIVDPYTWRDNYCPKEPDKIHSINMGDLNAVLLGSWITIKVCSNINLSMRDVDFSYPDEALLTGVSRTFYPLSELSTGGNYKIPESSIINSGVSSLMSLRYNFTLPDVPYIKNVFENRIAYSNISVTDAFKNGYRVFSQQSFSDIPNTYGSITKLEEINDNILCIFEHGVAILPINERVLQNGSVYLTNKIIPETPVVLSDKFGSLWKDSIIKTPMGVYGVDTVAKKIWLVDMSNQLRVISEFIVQEFLNNNITLTEREKTPLTGIRNVKSHFNAFKNDVMFTFYDNLYGFEEKAWNLCFNERYNKFITFYSWIPSFSENIDNLYFSFNRDTSKWISKLGTSNAKSNMADGVVLNDVVFGKKIPQNLEIKNNIEINKENYYIDSFKYKLSLVNRPLPDTSLGVTISNSFELQRDIFGNYKHFYIDSETNELCSIILNLTSEEEKKKELEFLESKPAIALNIKANIDIVIDTTLKDSDIRRIDASKYKNMLDEFYKNNIGFYESSIFITSEKVILNDMTSEEKRNSPNLATHFWKHGLSGIIDIKEKILPCKWYGKQHPFEFEFVVSENPDFLKIFDQLKIIGNNVAPESIHYEIIGDCFDFKDDKLNMYVRQEFTKDLFLYNGSDILFDRRALKLPYILNHIPNSIHKVKSTMFPLYYSRLDTINEIEDYYKLMTSPNKDYNNLSGAELVYYDNLKEFRIWNHTKGCPLGQYYKTEITLAEYEKNYIPGLYFYELNVRNNKLQIYENSKNIIIFDPLDNVYKVNENIQISNPNITNDILKYGVTFYKKDMYTLLRSNMSYNNDSWKVLINPILLCLKNERWNTAKDAFPKIPIVVSNSPVPEDIKNIKVTEDIIPENLKNLKYNINDLDHTVWIDRKEIKLKDKFIKIRIRYKGDNLTLITAISTLYRLVL